MKKLRHDMNLEKNMDDSIKKDILRNSQIEINISCE
jgi:hypothetical protein